MRFLALFMQFFVNLGQLFRTQIKVRRFSGDAHGRRRILKYITLAVAWFEHFYRSLLHNNHAMIALEWLQNLVIYDREFFFQLSSDFNENVFAFPFDVDASRFDR